MDGQWLCTRIILLSVVIVIVPHPVCGGVNRYTK